MPHPTIAAWRVLAALALAPTACALALAGALHEATGR